MANTVIALKKSGIPSAIPVNLANGELAINYADGKLFYKTAAGAIQEISGGGGGGGNAFGTVNANGTLVVADTSGDVLTLIPGNGITIVGDAITDSITISSVADVTLPYDTANAAYSVANSAYNKANTSFNLNGQDIYLGNTTTLSKLSNSSYNLILNSDGSLTVPNGMQIPAGSDFYFNGPSAGAPNYWGSININWGSSPNYSSFQMNKYGAYLFSSERVQVVANTKTWNFDNAGNLTFPDGTVQSTAYVTEVFDKANSANLLAYNTGIGANAFTSETMAGANIAVGTGANSYADIVGTSANAFASATIAGANAAVGAGANTVGSAAFDAANTKLSSSGGTITGDLSVVGNLSVSGNTSYISVQNYRVDDPLIYLAGNNYVSDIVDIGFVANYVNSTGSNVHTGLYREHENKMYYLFNGYDKEPENNHIGAMSNNMTLAVLNADMITSNLTLGGQNTIVWVRSAYDQANTANLLAYNTGIGANAFTSATIAGANTAVGAGANAFTSATIAGANTAVGGGANAYANLVWSRANVSMNLDSVNATRYIVFDDAVTGTLSRANVSYGLTYEPSSNTLTASGNLVVGTATSTTKFDLSGSFAQNIVAVAASAVDCSAGNYFTKTVSGALNWTVTNIPASRSYSFLLELTNGGSGTQTWFSGTKWAGGAAPTLTTTGVDLLGFITDDGGTTWNGILIGKDLR